MQIAPADFIIIAKYIVAVAIIIAIFCAPVWLARQTKKTGVDMIIIRLGAWMFGWTGVGWLFAIYWATKK